MRPQSTGRVSAGDPHRKVPAAPRTPVTAVGRFAAAAGIISLSLAVATLAMLAAAPHARAHTIDDGGTPPPGQDNVLELPLERGKLSLQDGNKRKVVFRARWRGAAAGVDPTTGGALLRIAGGPAEGDSGAIQLPAEKWHRRGKGFRYADPSGAHGGIRTLVLRIGASGGQVKIKGGQGNWGYAIDRPQSYVAVTLEIGAARWCADFHQEHLKRNRANGGPVRQVVAKAKDGPERCPCGGTLTSTWSAIQTMFTQHGCTQSICHGDARQGGLDLRPDVAYANLVGVESVEFPPQLRVLPGDKDESLLYRKLAAQTLGLTGAGRGMPLPDAPPLSEDQLRLVALWIYNGAPETDVVPGSQNLLASCVPPPTPQKIPPPEPPAPGVGVQLHGAAWSVPVESEDEVCYATYYDFSAEIPAQFRGPCPEGRGQPGTECFFYNRAQLVQDPNSHHSIPRVYVGAYDVTHPGFGTFTCHGGPQDGAPCNPKGLGVAAPEGADCGAGGGCAGTVRSAVACLGYGPPDFAHGFNLADSANAPYLLISTEPRYVTDFPAGVMEAMPVRGTMVWNSHAFNATGAPTTNEQWLQLYFAPPDEQQFLLQDFFDIEDIFVANVPPFEERQYCRTVTFKQGTRLFEMTSHTHKRGVLFEVWGPGIFPPCRSGAGDVCEPEPGEPILRTIDFADPDQVIFNPPLVFDDEDLASRTIKYCARYDNGLSDPSNVKRFSTAPPSALRCSPAQIRCLDGPRRGQPCGGDHAACDSTPGAGDGLCDACPVRGWVTADDEMFALLGSYYCAEGVDCALPVLAGIPPIP
jgi:hypothetical protein